jgi:hypothetical protein
MEGRHFELDAHFYYATIFHDLVADERLKAKAAEHVARIADHIIQHGWTLTDVDGLPTVWGRWDPAYFQSMQGFYAKGLNGLGVLSYMRTAGALSGAPRFDEAVKTLVNMGYAPPVLRQKLTSPAAFVNHSDDRLAFYNYFHLLRHETDPALRSIYRRSLERSWAIERIEFNPWFNFIYGALTHNECEVAASVAHLRAWPLRWSESPDQLVGGSGHEVVDPSGWLDAYWMGRYFGMILPPETSDAALLTVPPMPLREDVVAYDGPPMPNILE